MNAIRRIDLQPQFALLARHLIHSRGAKILAGIAVLDDAFRRANIRVGHVKVARLIFFVPRAGMIDVGQAIERQLAIARKSRSAGRAGSILRYAS